MPDLAHQRGWRRVRLQDVVDRYQELSQDPSRDGLSRFLKVEHMDQGRLRVSRWGEIAEEELPPTFHNIFRSGHVLFPSRNPHLRRTVWPDFDGVCGEKTFVLEAREGLKEELLPFIMQSDAVVEHAVRMKVGSTNPHVRWRDLASFQFALPPPEEQERIAKILMALLSAENAYQESYQRGAVLLRATAESACWEAGWPTRPVVAIADSAIGGFQDGDWIESKDQSEEGIRLLQLADIGQGDFLDKSRRFVSNETFSRLNCTEVFSGDLLIARMAEPIGRACIVPPLGARCIAAVDCCVVRMNEAEHVARYWSFALNSRTWTRLVESAAAGSTRSRISRSNLEAILVPVPPRVDQVAIAERLASIKDAQLMIKARVAGLRAIARDILSTRLDGANG